jgi:hypothetical protein
VEAFAETFVGGSGIVPGVIGVDGDDAILDPFAFSATTTKE